MNRPGPNTTPARPRPGLRNNLSGFRSGSALCDDQRMGPGDLTNAQWARLEPLLPGGKEPGRPPVWSKRQLINGIRWRTRTGTPWRDVPARYGEWETVYGLFRRWQRDGTWKRILTRLQAEADAKGLITWDVNVDSTIARIHQHAAGPGKGGPAAGQTRRCRRRARQPRTRPFTRRVDHEAASGGGAGAEAARAGHHRRAVVSPSCSRPSWGRSGYRVSGRAVRAPSRTRFGRTRPTAPGRIASTCGDVGSRARSRRRPTRSGTA